MRDWRGTLIEVGDHVVYPSRQFSSMWMTEGEVVSIEGEQVAVRKIKGSAQTSTGTGRLSYPALTRLTVIG